MTAPKFPQPLFQLTDQLTDQLSDAESRDPELGGLIQMAQDLGYTHLRVLDNKLCGLSKFLFTTGLMVGINESGYERRYCFEHAADAEHALATWDAGEHPPGPWIKLKGAMNGQAIDMLNPATISLSQDEQSSHTYPRNRG